MASGESEAPFQDIEVVAIDLSRSEPPGKRMRELSALEIARHDDPLLGSVVFQLSAEPPEGWDECLRRSEGELGYAGGFLSELNGRSLLLDYDPERFDERFTGLKVSVANANLQYREILAERAENRRRMEEAGARYREKIASAAERLGIRTVAE
jgi:hypothetical protein